MESVSLELKEALYAQGFEVVGVDPEGRIRVTEINRLPEPPQIDVRAILEEMAVSVPSPRFRVRTRKERPEPAWRVRERQRRELRAQEREVYEKDHCCGNSDPVKT